MLRPYCSTMWLATLCVLLNIAYASASPYHSRHRHHHQHHHHHSSPSVSRRPFGKPARIWTPSQGPHRRSTDGRALEPFQKDAHPGFSFTHIYDVHLWDGGDKASCPRTALSKSTMSIRERRTGIVAEEAGSRVSRFCIHGNEPVEMPDQSICSHEGNLQRRIIPSFGQIEEIVNNGIEAGKEVHLAKLKAGLPDTPPSSPQPPALQRPAGGLPGGLGAGFSPAGGSLQAGGTLPVGGTFPSGGNSGTGQAATAGVTPAGVVRRSPPSVSEDGEKLDRRLIPTFGSVELNGLEGGKEVHLVGLKFGKPPSSPAMRRPPSTSKASSSHLHPGFEAVDHSGSGVKQVRLARRKDLQQQVLDLVDAAFKTSDDIASSMHAHPHFPQAARHNLHQRSPLGGMGMMGGMGGMGQGAAWLQALMPVILAGIQEGGKVVTALIESKTITDVEKMKEEAAYNRTLLAEGKTGGGAGTGANSGAAVSPTGGDAAKAGSAGGSAAAALPSASPPADSASTLPSSAGAAVATKPGQAKRDALDSISLCNTPSKTATYDDQCSGNAQFCMQVIESTFPFCRPPQHVHTGATSHRHSARELVRAMALHCTIKCSGFTHLMESRQSFRQRVEQCTEDPWLFDKIHQLVSADSLHTHTHQAHRQRSKQKRSTSTSCQAGYAPAFVNALRPVASYSNKLFGSVVSDPSSFLLWGVVHRTSDCLRACDQTAGCVFANVYQQSFSLDHPTITLPDRSEQDSRELFARQSERKKHSFVQGQLTCALYSRCFAECEADHASGIGEPVFFERSVGWCKSQSCPRL